MQSDPEAIIKGLEFDFQARPFGNLFLSGGIGLINDDYVSQNKYGLLNGRIAWTLWDDKTTLAVFGRNLLDRGYLDGGFSVEDTIGSKPVFFGRPRTYGIEILRRF